MVIPMIWSLSATPEASSIWHVQEIVYLCGNVGFVLTKSDYRSDGVGQACTAVVVCCPCDISYKFADLFLPHLPWPTRWYFLVNRTQHNSTSFHTQETVSISDIHIINHPHRKSQHLSTSYQTSLCFPAASHLVLNAVGDSCQVSKRAKTSC